MPILYRWFNGTYQIGYNNFILPPPPKPKPIKYYTFNSNSINGTALANMASGTAVYDGATLDSTTVINTASPKLGNGCFYTTLNTSTNRSPCVRNVTFTIDNTNGFTLAMWMNTGGYFRQFSCFFVNQTNNDWIGCQDTGGSTKFSFFILSRSANSWYYISTGYSGTNGWQHFVFTAKNDSNGMGTYNIYVDGVLINTMSNMPLPTIGSYNGYIGDGVNQPTYMPGYNGYLDEFYLYNTSLTSDQVYSLYSKNIIL